MESGGDGAYVKYGTFRSGIAMKDWFGRFSYDFTDDVNAYVQATWAEAGNTSNWINWVVSPSAEPPQYAVRQQSVPGPGDATAAGRRHRLRYAGCDGLALPARCARDLAADRDARRRRRRPRRIFSAPSYIWNNVDGEERRARTACTSPRRASGT